MTRSEQGETAQVIENFDQMGLKELLLRGIYTQGFEKPSPIQARAIKPCCEGRDMICQAQWGTGKTLTFCVPVLQRIDEKLNAVQALVLTPTRELANQTAEIMQQLSQFMGVKVITLIGGTNVRDDERKLIEERVHVVVGTPGRVTHMLDGGALETDKVKIFVVDEADEMLKEGFLESVHKIFQSFPKDVQVVFMSATMPNDMLEVIGKIMVNPVKILVKAGQLTLEGIAQFYIHLEAEHWKFDTLCDLYDSVSISKAVIFCSSKKGAEELKSKMVAEKFRVSCIHSDMTQGDRYKAIRDFRSGSSRVLIATDQHLRGIDLGQVLVVINYELPDNKESYIRRIGHSRHYGRKGCAINFVVGDDLEKMREMERFYRTEIKELPKDIKKYIQNEDPVLNDGSGKAISVSDLFTKWLDSISKLGKSGDFSDCTLMVGGEELKAHRSILSAISPIFGKMFGNEAYQEARDGIVRIEDPPGMLKDSTSKPYKALLSYAYTGRVDWSIFGDCKCDVLVVACKYLVLDLKRHVEGLLVSEIAIDSCIEMIILADTYSCEILKKACAQFFCSNYAVVVLTTRWEALMKSGAEMAIQLLRLVRERKTPASA